MSGIDAEGPRSTMSINLSGRETSDPAKRVMRHVRKHPNHRIRLALTVSEGSGQVPARQHIIWWCFTCYITESWMTGFNGWEREK